MFSIKKPQSCQFFTNMKSFLCICDEFIIHLFSFLNTNETIVSIFLNKTRERFNLANILYSVTFEQTFPESVFKEYFPWTFILILRYFCQFCVRHVGKLPKLRISGAHQAFGPGRIIWVHLRSQKLHAVYSYFLKYWIYRKPFFMLLKASNESK